MEVIHVSPSGIATYENCPRSYLFDRVLRVSVSEKRSALGFGGALATAMEAFMKGTIQGTFVDPVPIFTKGWSEFTSKSIVKYGKGESEHGLTATGIKLMELFPEAWDREGLTVALDKQSNPMIERKMRVDLGEGTRLVTKLDLMAYNRDWELFLIDQKSTKQRTDIRFAMMGEQLTAYQVAFKAHQELLGLDSLKGLAFWELLKKPIPKRDGEGPVVTPIEVVGTRSDADMDQFVVKARSIAQRIRNRDFPKTPRMSWNSPCTGCNYLPLCAQKKVEDFEYESAEAKEAVMKIAA